MQTLEIILTFLFGFANAATTYFAITAWFELRRMKRLLIEMSHTLSVSTTITMGEHLRSCYQQLSDMKITLHRLVENEQFEDAERLKIAIAKMERATENDRKFLEQILDKPCEKIEVETFVMKRKDNLDEED